MAEAGVGAAVRSRADIPGVVAGGVAVNGGEEDVVASPEGALGSVAVVAVDVEDGDAVGAVGAEVFGGQGGVVDVAVAAGAGGVSVVAGGSG